MLSSIESVAPLKMLMTALSPCPMECGPDIVELPLRLSVTLPMKPGPPPVFIAIPPLALNVPVVDKELELRLVRPETVMLSAPVNVELLIANVSVLIASPLLKATAPPLIVTEVPTDCTLAELPKLLPMEYRLVVPVMLYTPSTVVVTRFIVPLPLTELVLVNA